MKVRSRDAWLAAIAAALGASELACKKDGADGPAVAREVTSASASASSSAPEVAASAPPEASASASATASTSTLASPSATPKPTSTGLIGLGTIGHGACGGSAYVNPICGARAGPREPTANVLVRVIGPDPVADDQRTLQSQLRTRLRSCANNAAKRDPTTHGDLTLQLAIDAHGSVTQVDAESSTIDGGFLQCMRSATRATRFPEGAARTIHVLIRVQMDS